MSKKYEKLKGLLKELFQLDQPDLDFGLYRIMHAKSAEITQFLDKDLLPQVKAEFARHESGETAELQKQLQERIELRQKLGDDPDQDSEVQRLRAEIASSGSSPEQLESEVYDHLFGFFRRYYSDGDFLSKRVYKPGVYAIPYEGEEVKLHWANADQYYIKTSEYLRDYAFRLRVDNDENPMRVHFRLADVVEGEHGNVKAAEGKDRVFILAPEYDRNESTAQAAGSDDGDEDETKASPERHNFIEEEPGEQGEELVIRFEYRQATTNDWPESNRKGQKKPPSQKDLLEIAESRIAAFFAENEGLKNENWHETLASAHTKANGEKADYSRLRAHLNRYVARNTFDYFIHKDLGGFLSRELDFYIKNEVMHLDDIENETVPRVEQYLSKIKVIRRVAGKIISFLAQLEDFQKKLWLKKKFVVQTGYCISLNHIPDVFLNEIVENELQLDQWIELFAIDEIEEDPSTPLLKDQQVPYSKPLTPAFLKQNKGLIVDTTLFDDSFTERILNAIDGVDSFSDGTLVHGENFQALSLVERKMREQSQCVYIDPPYNTASSRIPYKNDYQHSTFASLMHDRVQLLHRLLTSDGAIFVSIDKTERQVVEHVLENVFGSSNKVEELVWVMNTNNSQAPNYSTNHEYVIVFARDKAIAESKAGMFREPKPGYEEVMELIAPLNAKFATIAEIESAVKALYQERRISYRDDIEAQGLDYEKEKSNDPWKGIFNYTHAEYRDACGRLVDESEAESKNAKIWIWQEDNMSMPASKQAASTKDEDHPNFRFYNPPHPVTGKPCPRPKRGWNCAYALDANDPSRRSFQMLDADGRVAWGEDENKVPRIKRMLHEVETNVAKSVFSDYSDGEKQTSAMFGKTGMFLAPKHASFVSRFIMHSSDSQGLVVDCFGGSGSTGHAVVSLNRSDRGSRQFLLVEMAEYFDRVLKPRTLKSMYASDWRDGKPKSRLAERHIVKVVRLESYEDSLNNLQTRQSGQQTLALETNDEMREQYMLRYMLDVETAGSPSLLNVASFIDPTAYKLKVKRPGSDETRETNVDLIETFNWLIGLTVHHLAAPQCFEAKFQRDKEKRMKLNGRLKSKDDAPHWFRTVTGTTPDGRKTLVIWRKRPGGEDPEGVEQDNLVLDEWFTKSGYSSKDSEFDLIYVNGTNNLENLRTATDTWKVRLIEEDFHRLMFEDTE
ncbi:DNA methyltransferase [Rhodopirellula islandica]|nr:DNA methyltransferase [Rhodopirellula islandica]